MKEIVLTGIFGDQEKKIKVSFVHGNSGGLHLTVDNWYEGVVIKRGGEWFAYLNARAVLCSNDISVLCDRIDNIEVV